MVKISIVIPTKNGEKTIKRCLNAIKIQTLIKETEVIIIDSGSNDNTIEIVKAFNFVRLYQIPSDEFGHGRTRNLGLSLAKGEFIVYTVQDAWAADEFWLETMLKHFSDKKLAMVVGQQVVPHEKNINPHQWWRPVSQPQVYTSYFPQKEDFLKLTGKQQDEACIYDNVNSMYRKSVLEKIKFDDVEFGEDMIISKKIILNGYKIVYDANSTVWHYHFKSKDYIYKSIITELYYKKIVFNYIPKIRLNLKDFALIVYRNFKYRANLFWIFHNWQIKIFEYIAYRDFLKHNKNDEDLKEFYKKVNPIVVQGKLK